MGIIANRQPHESTEKQENIQSIIPCISIDFLRARTETVYTFNGGANVFQISSSLTIVGCFPSFLRYFSSLLFFTFNLENLYQKNEQFLYFLFSFFLFFFSRNFSFFLEKEKFSLMKNIYCISLYEYCCSYTTKGL